MKKFILMFGICVAVCALGIFAQGSKITVPQKQQGGTLTNLAVLKAAVHVAASGLGATAVNAKGAYDTKVIRKFVDAVRFLDDKTGYFYVYDSTNNFCIAHAIKKDFEGKDKSDYTDSRKMKVIQALSKMVKAKPAGDYLVFYFMNPKTKKEEKKLGYAEMIPGTTLYIGSGIYIK